MSVCIIYLRFICLLGVYLFYTAVSVAAAQQSESAVCTHASPLCGFPSRLGTHGALSGVLSAAQQVLISHLLYT